MTASHARWRHVYQHVWCTLNDSRTVLQKIFQLNVYNDSFTVQLVECVFNVSAVLVRDTHTADDVHPTRPPASTDQRFQLPAMVDSLLQGPKSRNPPDLNPVCWKPHVRLNEGNILTPQVELVFRAVCDGAPSCCSVHSLLTRLCNRPWPRTRI